MRFWWNLSSAYRPMMFSQRFRMDSAARRSLLLLAGSAFAITLAGCAQQPQQRVTQQRSKEYFPEGKYGTASPRVVADGEAVPRGGGRYLVGRPYTIAGRTYYPSERQAGYTVTGNASWYGAAFHGRRTANGEIYDRHAISAAHPTMPLPSYARVTNLKNGHSIIVRVNDRGPYHGGRVLDMSQRAAEMLDYKNSGTARVKVEYVAPAGLAGSDDRKLIASLRTDGQPATMDGTPTGSPVMVAQRQPAPQRLALVEQQEMRQQPVEMRTVQPQFQPAPPQPAQTTIAAVPATTTAFAPTAPLPPSRPFDLGTIPGAGVPVAAARPRLGMMNYAADQSVTARLKRDNPFGSLKQDGAASWGAQALPR